MTDRIFRSSQWGVALAIALILLLAYPLRYVLLPFVAAGALTYVARPLLHGLERQFRFPRWAAALIAFVLFLVVLAAGAYAIVRVLLPQVWDMLGHSREVLEQFLRNVFHGEQIRLPSGTITVQQAANEILQWSPLTSGKPGEPMAGSIQAAQLVGLATTGITVIMGFVLTVVLFGFFLFTGAYLANGLLWLVPPHLRPTVQALAAEIDPMLGRYLRGICLVILFTSAVTWIVTGPVFHVSNAIFLSIVVGLLELIPVLGPILSFVTFALVAVQQRGLAGVIGFGMFAIALRLAIDQLVGPLVLGRAARIPAVLVIFSFLAGGVLYGMLGVVLAIPFAATVKIVLTHLYDESPDPADSQTRINATG